MVVMELIGFSSEFYWTKAVYFSDYKLYYSLSYTREIISF